MSELELKIDFVVQIIQNLDYQFDKVVLLGYPKRTMIQNVYGIKQFQTKLPEMARQIDEIGGHYLVTRRNKPSFVAIPFADYQEIEDILLELNSLKLQKEIAQGREEYRQGKTKTLDEVMAQLDSN